MLRDAVENGVNYVAQRRRFRLGGQHAAESERGSGRPENQDVAWSSAKSLIVADGVGSTALGGVAARVAVAHLRRFQPRAGTADNEARLRNTLLMADTEIRAVTEVAARNGCTVLAAAWRVGDRLYVANCGDVEILIWRQSTPDQIQRCSADHSFRALGIAVKPGYDDGAPARQIGNGPRWMGDEAAALRSYPIANGDVVLAMSDGVHRFVQESALLPILMAVGEGALAASQACRCLNGAALVAGSDDDRSSAVLVAGSSADEWHHRVWNTLRRLAWRSSQADRAMQDQANPAMPRSRASR